MASILRSMRVVCEVRNDCTIVFVVCCLLLFVVVVVLSLLSRATIKKAQLKATQLTAMMPANPMPRP